MTVENQVPITRKVYTGPGEYTFTFKVYDEETVMARHITASGVQTVLQYPSEYTVTLNSGSDGGHIDTLAPVSAGGYIDIYRESVFEQQIDLVGQGRFDPETLERGFDEAIMMLQQLKTTVDGVSVLSNWRGSWVSGTTYAVRDVIQAADSNWYYCVTPHTSGVFATDLASGIWILVINQAEIISAKDLAVASAAAALVSENNAAISKSAAELAETNAEISAAAALVSENNAAASALAAGISETNASVSEVNAALSETEAQKWAENPEDVPVEIGKFSALHWAEKARELTDELVHRTSSTGSAQIPAGTLAQRDGSPATGYLRFNTDDETFEGYNGTEWTGIGGGGLEWVPAATNTTAEKNKGVMMDTTGGTKVVTPIATPAVGDSFGVADWKDTFHLNKCTIAFTGIKVHGVVQTEDMILDVKGQRVILTYTGADQGWIITDLIPDGFAIPAEKILVNVVQNCRVRGFEITNTGANQLTVTKGQCLDSTLSVPIAVTGNTVLTLDATPNKLFTIAAVILNNGTHTCKVYDSEAAMAADVGVNITHFAYIGWWQNNGSGAEKAGRLFGAGDGLAELWWAKASENAVNSKVAVPGNCNTAISLASYLPSSDRVAAVLPGGQGSASNSVGVGFDGTNTSHFLLVVATAIGDTELNCWSYGTDLWLPIVNNTIYWGDGGHTNSGTADIRLHATRFRR